MNNISVGSVGFDRAVKFQFNSGEVEFNYLVSNGEVIYLLRYMQAEGY
jgi:hypothetical protein